jgi:hypothetical protein
MPTIHKIEKVEAVAQRNHDEIENLGDGLETIVERETNLALRVDELDVKVVAHETRINQLETLEEAGRKRLDRLEQWKSLKDRLDVGINEPAKLPDGHPAIPLSPEEKERLKEAIKQPMPMHVAPSVIQPIIDQVNEIRADASTLAVGLRGRDVLAPNASALFERLTDLRTRLEELSKRDSESTDIPKD